MASLAELNLESTMLCKHCVALLFGRVAYCPYCGDDGTGTSYVAAPAIPDTEPAPLVSFARAESVAQVADDLAGMPWQAVPKRFETTGANDADLEPDPAPDRAAGAAATHWNAGRTAGLGLCVLALALGVFHVNKTGTPSPREVPRALTPVPASQRAPEAEKPRATLPPPAPAQAAPVEETRPASAAAALAIGIAPPNDTGCSDAMVALALCTTTPATDAGPEAPGRRAAR